MVITRDIRFAKIVKDLSKMRMSSHEKKYMPDWVCKEYASRLLDYDAHAVNVRSLTFYAGYRLVIEYRVKDANDLIPINSKFTFVTESIIYHG